MRLPPQRRVVWPTARRIITTRHPPIDLFEDIADPQDWELLASAESKTNPRIIESIGRLDLVPPERRIGGPGSSYVMSTFTHVSPDWAGRFHDGTFGAYYVAETFATAVAETVYHHELFYRATQEQAGWFAQFRELVGRIDNNFHDIRKVRAYRDCLKPDDYGLSQALARKLREQGADGIVYPSVRDSDGPCLAAFWPDVVAVPKPGRALAYHFDGERIDLVRDETSKDLFRVV